MKQVVNLLVLYPLLPNVLNIRTLGALRKYLADLPAVLPGQDDLGRLCGRRHQALRQLGVPAVAQLEGDRELKDYSDCGGCAYLWFCERRTAPIKTGVSQN